MKTNKFSLPQLSKRKIKSIYSEMIGYRKDGIRVEHQMISGKHVIHNYGQGLCNIDLAYGSAFIAIKAMMIKIDNNKANNVAVIGNDINAIMTCIELIKRGFRITLYSENQFKLLNMNESTEKSAPRGYTLWFPDGYDWDEDLLKHQLLSKFSYDHFQECMRFHRYRSAHETTVVEFNRTAEDLREVVSDLIFDNYRPINLDYGNGQHQQVIAYNTIVVDNSLYFEELKTELVLRGGKFIKKQLNKLADVLALNEEIVINCLGAASNNVFPDEKLHAKEVIVVDLEVQEREKGKEVNVRLHLQDNNNYEIVQRNGNLKIRLPPKSLQQPNQAYIQKHLFKLDAFFKTRRQQTAKL